MTTLEFEDSPAVQVTADREGVRIYFPDSDNARISIQKLIDTLVAIRDLHANLEWDYSEFDGDGHLLDFIYPEPLRLCRPRASE